MNEKKGMKLIVSLLLGALLLLSQPIAVRAEIERSDHSADLTRTGIPLYEWQDASISKPRAIVVAIHGAAQQAGALDALSRRLAALGYLVIAPDMRGNGRWRDSSEAKEEKSGGAYGDYLRTCSDLDVILSVLRREHPGKPIFCIGESAGAVVVLNAVAHNSHHLKGIVLCSTGCLPKLHNPANMEPGFLTKLLKVNQPVDMSNFIGRYASDDKRVTAEMVNDPLGRNSLSALDLLGTFNFISQAPRIARQLPKSIPVLVLQGEEDQIVDPLSANVVFSNLRTADKNFILLPGSGHVLIGTSYLKAEVYNAIASWLAAHGGLPFLQSPQ